MCTYVHLCGDKIGSIISAQWWQNRSNNKWTYFVTYYWTYYVHLLLNLFCHHISVHIYLWPSVVRCTTGSHRYICTLMLRKMTYEDKASFDSTPLYTHFSYFTGLYLRLLTRCWVCGATNHFTSFMYRTYFSDVFFFFETCEVMRRCLRCWIGGATILSD